MRHFRCDSTMKFETYSFGSFINWCIGANQGQDFSQSTKESRPHDTVSSSPDARGIEISHTSDRNVLARLLDTLHQGNENLFRL